MQVAEAEEMQVLHTMLVVGALQHMQVEEAEEMTLVAKMLRKMRMVGSSIAPIGHLSIAAQTMQRKIARVVVPRIVTQTQVAEGEEMQVLHTMLVVGALQQM